MLVPVGHGNVVELFDVTQSLCTEGVTSKVASARLRTCWMAVDREDPVRVK